MDFSRDPNYQYYHLAFGVVETKTKESWRWFLQLLIEDIGDQRKCIFISYQYKVPLYHLFYLLSFVSFFLNFHLVYFNVNGKDL